MQAQAKAEEIKMLLAPYITVLTPEQRRTLAKMGDKTLAFVEKAHELALTNPVFVPPFLNMAEFTIDFSDAHNIEPVLVLLEQLRSGVDDTQMLAGSEAYQAALVFYNSVKEAASKNVPGAKAVYDALRVRFPHKKRRGEEGSPEE
jgi:ribosomal protein L14